MHNAVKYSKVQQIADDSNLLSSHKDLKILRKRINEDLASLFDWLCSNKLSLNVSKTEFIIFRPLRTMLTDRIVLKLNGKKIFESNKVRYLGVILDNKLSWKYHIFELRKKLNRAVGMLYKLKNTGCQKNVLLSVYHSIFQSHLNYALCAWGNTSKFYLENIYLTQKRAIRAIAGLAFDESTKKSFSALNILKISDLFKYQFASLMWDQDHNCLPKCFKSFFVQVSYTHCYNTRSAAAGNLYVSKWNTKTHGEILLRVQGPKFLNEIKNLEFYSTSKTKKYFLRKYKRYLVSAYNIDV